MNLKAQTEVVDHKIITKLEDSCKKRRQVFNAVFQSLILAIVFLLFLFSASAFDNGNSWHAAEQSALGILIVVAQIVILSKKCHIAIFVFLRLLQTASVYGVKNLIQIHEDIDKTLSTQVGFTLLCGLILADYSLNQPSKTKAQRKTCVLLLASMLAIALIFDVVFCPIPWSANSKMMALVSVPVTVAVLALAVVAVTLYSNEKSGGHELKLSALSLITLINLLLSKNFGDDVETQIILFVGGFVIYIFTLIACMLSAPNFFEAPINDV
ncbi:uncharacterized protein LOC143466136 [Clavelina lepadiformis]|uniref:uncharacterized protein LOC143466136 n=1 Tax=Clavelina lepadiformis TaxID=159417 RepID=UPI0040417237